MDFRKDLDEAFLRAKFNLVNNDDFMPVAFIKPQSKQKEIIVVGLATQDKAANMMAVVTIAKQFNAIAVATIQDCWSTLTEEAAKEVHEKGIHVYEHPDSTEALHLWGADGTGQFIWMQPYTRDENNKIIFGELTKFDDSEKGYIYNKWWDQYIRAHPDFTE